MSALHVFPPVTIIVFYCGHRIVYSLSCRKCASAQTICVQNRTGPAILVDPDIASRFSRAGY